MKRGWELGGVGRIIHHLRCAKRPRRRRWCGLKLGEGCWRWVTVKVGTGGCDLGPLVLHKEPDGKSSDNTEGGESPNNTPSNGTCMRTPSPTGRALC